MQGIAGVSDLALLKRRHMGCDPGGCRFTDFGSTGGKRAERLGRFEVRSEEIGIAGRGFAVFPESPRVPTEGPGDHLVRVRFAQGLRWRLWGKNPLPRYLHQSTGSAPRAASQWFTRLKGREPKKPRRAERGEGWAVSRTR